MTRKKQTRLGIVKEYMSTHKYARWFLWYIAPSLIVLLFFSIYLFSGNKLISGDFDYYAQLYEAARITILDYHQFPDWNPWMSGGIPLYANPQYGLVSVQTLTTLLFGGVYGLKIAYIIYALAGYWGMYFFVELVTKTDRLRAHLLSFIWVASGFFYGHNISHFTFSSFFLIPWLMLLLYARHTIRRSWIFTGVLLGLLGLSSIHYAFLMMLFVYVIFVTGQILLQIVMTLKKQSTLTKLKKEIFFAVGSMTVATILLSHKVIATFAYMTANERLVSHTEKYPDLLLLIKAMFLPIGSLLTTPSNLQWGWGEYSMYIGLGTGMAFVIGVLLLFYKKHSYALRGKGGLLLSFMAFIVLCTLIALGDRGHYSAFSLLRELPGFEQTRVPSRWMIFTVFFILSTVALFKSYRHLVNVFLVAGCLELAYLHGPISMARWNMIDTSGSHFGTFQQYDNEHKHTVTEPSKKNSFYYATRNNQGQIYSIDSVVDTFDGIYATSRCGINLTHKCSFIQSDNASIVYWSPNKVVLKRTGPGLIQLNMNPYYRWKVNTAYPFNTYRKLDPVNNFVINDESLILTITYTPRYSPYWLQDRL